MSGTGQQFILGGVLPASSSGYRLMAGRGASSGPQDGLPVGGAFGTSVTLNGQAHPPEAVLPLPGAAPFVLTLCARDLSAALGQDGRYTVTLLSYDGSAWSRAGVWTVAFSTQPPSFYAQGQRLANGSVIVSVYNVALNATQLRAEWNGGSLSTPWDGTLDLRSGSRIFTLILPAAAADILLTTTDRVGNEAHQTLHVAQFRTAVDAPAYLRWNVPPWLRGPQAGIFLDAVAHGLPRSVDVTPISATSATGEYLDIHARLHGVTRTENEGDTSFRQRILARARGAYVARAPLEAHLSALAGIPVLLTDTQSIIGRGAVLLDGGHRLDHSWRLGEPGGDTAPGCFQMRIQANPHVPLARLISELDRLRPVGRLYTALLEHTQDTPLHPRTTGALTFRARLVHPNASLAPLRLLDGSWMPNGSLTLNSGHAVRSAHFVRRSFAARVLDGTWTTNGGVQLAAPLPPV